jgi:uncharacterized protein
MPDFYAPWTVQLAGAEGEAAMTFAGLAAVYGQPDDGRPYTFARNAFDRPAAEARAGRFPAMLLQHGGLDLTADDMMPIGIWTKLEATEAGLRVEGRLADTQRGRDVHALMRMDPRPAIDGLSIGFRPTKRTENADARPGDARWTVQEIDLIEISVVTFPAMAAARVSSVQSGAGRERDLERWLVRDAGLTRREARALLRSGLSGIEALRDAGDAGEQSAEGEGQLDPAALDHLAQMVKRNIQRMKG